VFILSMRQEQFFGWGAEQNMVLRNRRRSRSIHPSKEKCMKPMVLAELFVATGLGQARAQMLPPAKGFSCLQGVSPGW